MSFIYILYTIGGINRNNRIIKLSSSLEPFDYFLPSFLILVLFVSQTVKFAKNTINFIFENLTVFFIISISLVVRILVVLQFQTSYILRQVFLFEFRFDNFYFVLIIYGVENNKIKLFLLYL